MCRKAKARLVRRSIYFFSVLGLQHVYCNVFAHFIYLPVIHCCFWHQVPLPLPALVKLYDVATANTCMTLCPTVRPQSQPHIAATGGGPRVWLHHSVTSMWRNADACNHLGVFAPRWCLKGMAGIPVRRAVRNLKLDWSSGWRRCFKKKLCLWLSSF